jgi:hypothetical protein
MNKESFVILLAAGTITLTTTLFGQTAQITGQVLAVSSSTITVQSGADVWDIKRTQSTSVKGTLKVGSTVTVSYNTPDAQKKEGPTTTTNPTPTPAGE